MIAVGTNAPPFTAPDQNALPHSLGDYAGKWLVIYFYPKDDTPGCTTEACGLRDSYTLLQKYAVIVGVSPDSVESHKAFAEKYHLPFTLLSDTDKSIIKAYGASGVFTKRMTYIVDPTGVVVKSYSNVDPAHHAEEILRDLQTIASTD